MSASARVVQRPARWRHTHDHTESSVAGAIVPVPQVAVALAGTAPVAVATGHPAETLKETGHA